MHQPTTQHQPAEKLTSKGCLEIFRKIHSDNPQITNKRFCEVVYLAYPKGALLPGGLTQQVWDKSLEKFLAERSKFLNFQNAK